MGFSMPPVLTIVAMVSAAVGLIMQIVGVATPAWVVPDEGDGGSGLWELCGPDGTCLDLGDYFSLLRQDVPDWYDACRAFGIVAVLLLAGCLLLAVLTCFLKQDKLPLVAAILALVSAVCIVIEFSLYADRIGRRDAWGLGYSFALTIVACLLALAAGVCLVVVKIKS